MVVYTNASSPKRRRTDDAQPPTPQQVAETNATLHMFLNNRQNRWVTSPIREEGATGLGQVGAGRHVDNTRQSPNAQSSRPPALNINTLAGQSSTVQQNIVNYESPHTAQVPTPMTAAAALQSRPPSATTPHHSLPSPAPSEEQASSPRRVIVIPDEPGTRMQSHIPAKRPRGRPRKYPVLNPNFAGVGPVPAPHASPRAMINPNTPSHLQANMHLPAASSNLAPAGSRANSVAHTSNAALSPQQGMQPALPPRPPSSGGLLSVVRMQHRLKDFFEPRAQIINPIDHGRRTLVQEAIEKEDFFYLALSQVFCLYTCRRELVPKQLERVHPSSWVHLEQLLCSNQAMSPLVVQWFAEFPAPVHIIFNSGESQFYMNQLLVVESFLQELPRRWDHIVNVSKRRLAPPLTQEMVGELYLISPVVQTTTFRALARSFWGGEDNPGLHYLETLHKIDQNTYTYQQWRRSKAEKKTAYGVYARVFSAWKQQRAAQGAGISDFVPPPGCEYFRQPPPSMNQNPNPGITNPNAQFSRGTAQQLQMIEMNHRLLAQRQTVPGFSAEQQQQILLQSNNHMIAQQGLSQSPLQQQQYHFNPPQQQPMSQYSTMTLPPNGIVPLHQVIPTQMAAYQQPSHMAPHLGRLLPAENALPRPQPVQPDTVRVSLHQAHLRSPIPGNRQPLPGEQSLYRHVTGYALAPTQLDSTICAQTVTLSLSQDELDKIPNVTPSSSPGEPGVRTLKEGSTLYRLRCSRMPLFTGFDTEASWVKADNVWPEILTFQVNGEYLEARRKLTHGRYLPIDLSSLLQAGANIMNVYTVPRPQDQNTYAVAIERVSVSSHASIVSAVTLISATDSLVAIKHSLEASADEDDDIAMTSSTLTIPLFDPFHADRICDTPVRGSACLHRECFDLQTFLSQCKRELPGYPCATDCWRCPICKGDVRPQTLVKDGFLVQVKEELAQKGLLDTRAIVVEADGSWKPRVEAQPSGVRSASLEREEEAAAAAMAAAANSKISVVAGTAGKGKGRVVEVIELD